MVSYDATYPAFAQNDDWSCAPTSTRWGLHAYGRTPTEAWLESSMLSSGVVSVELGLLDASGAGLADWIIQEYGAYGYGAWNDGSVSFDDVRSVAGVEPLMLGGRAWGTAGHWSGVRAYDASLDRLLLANPAPGYGGITQTMSRQQFAAIGPCSLVAITWDGDETVPPDPEYAGPGDVGSGLLALMAEDETVPALPSTFLPLGRAPALVEQVLGMNGTLYTWHLPTGISWRHEAD